MLVQHRHSIRNTSSKVPLEADDDVLSTRLFTVYQVLLLAIESSHDGRTPVVKSRPSALSPHSFVYMHDDRTHLDLAQICPVALHAAPYTSPSSTTVTSRKSMTEQWCAGDISNLEYLMAVNAAAGRSIVRTTTASTTAHAVLPWVTDFTLPYTDDGTCHHHLRDLTMSKYRLTKGDDHLDLMYRHTGHHIPEKYTTNQCSLRLSDLSVAIYLARVLPRALLQRVVRSTFEPKEYPTSLAKMAASSPDECIPELFLDPSVLVSCHDDMLSLDLPSWCSTPDTCIAYHRRVLESPFVSAHLHAWIDVTFGVHLSGASAVRHRNVPHMGFVQEKPPHRGVSLNGFHARHKKLLTAKSFGARYATVLSPAYTLDDSGVAGSWFSVGCIVAELYLKRPLFSGHSIVEFALGGKLYGESFSVHKALPQLASLPPPIR
ncbi:hypothetical protein AaE_011121, partial [Aphanomyces astaci]